MRRSALHLVGILCLLLAARAAETSAAVALPGFFGDHMVLQREMPVPVWGTAKPGEAVTVTFAGQTKTATADADGKWMVKLDPLTASDNGGELVVKGENEITVKDVLVGEVWLCSGQSNMEWTVNRTLNAQEEAKAADLPGIRHLKIGHVNAMKPRDDVQGAWTVCTPQTVAHFTAVGFYFGRKLHAELNVPVGLIGSNWGGTRIEPWTPPVGFNAVPELASLAKDVNSWDATTEAGKAAWTEAVEKTRAWIDAAEAALKAGKAVPDRPDFPEPGYSHQEPTKLYNGMIHPLIPFAFRGAIWYQGESNGNEGESYYHKMRALIGGWRTVWNQGEFPFYYVQLANYTHDGKTPAGGQGYARLREAQRQALSIPHTGMAVIIDIGEAGNIHPRNKQDVGLRLARWAMANTYGKDDLVYSGPLYKSHKVEEGSIRISFDHVGSGLMVGKKEGLEPTKAVDEPLQRFAIAGADKKWVWAEARIDGDTVVVSSEEVKEPVAVRYAFDANPEGANLYNKEGLPASPFRTDAW